MTTPAFNTVKRMRPGFPPFSHWWLTSTPETSQTWRWFDKDQETWSVPVSESCTAEQAGKLAKIPCASLLAKRGLVLWCNYWPDGARTGRETPIKRVRLQDDSGSPEVLPPQPTTGIQDLNPDA